MKIIKLIIGIFVLCLGVVWLLGFYIGPDDIKGCGTAPGEKPQCQKADAIIAISGGDTKARAAEAIKLYQNGWGDFLIFSGAAADKSGPSNAKVMQQQALDAGVSPDVILIEEHSETTEQNADAAKDVFASRGIKSVIIVTSAYHTRRAGLEFNRRVDGVTFRRHTTPHDSGWNNWWWLTPYGWVTAVSEAMRSLVISTGGVDRSSGS